MIFAYRSRWKVLEDLSSNSPALGLCVVTSPFNNCSSPVKQVDCQAILNSSWNSVIQGEVVGSGEAGFQRLGRRGLLMWSCSIRQSLD